MYSRCRWVIGVHQITCIWRLPNWLSRIETPVPKKPWGIPQNGDVIFYEHDILNFSRPGVSPELTFTTFGSGAILDPGQYHLGEQADCVSMWSPPQMLQQQLRPLCAWSFCRLIGMRGNRVCVSHRIPVLYKVTSFPDDSSLASFLELLGQYS